MSAGTQLQMAPQTTVVQGGQQTTAHNQDSNMSTGSSHSDKEVESAGTPEKIPRTPSERKRKRKAPDNDSGGGVVGGLGGGNIVLGVGGNGGVNSIGSGCTPQQLMFQNNKGARVLPPPLSDTKKINDYFNRSSPIRQHGGTGAKSPSPQHGYPMYPPSPQPQLNVIGSGVVNQEFYKSRNTSNIVPSSPILPLAPPVCQPPPPPPPVLAKVSISTQTDLSYLEIQERDSDFELSKTKVDELTRSSEEQKGQISAHQKVIDQHKNHINKCIDVVKKLLKEKSNIEKKEARQKCMQNRLRLGQFVTQRVGATFQENWTDGYAFQELTRRQEEISAEREEIDRQKKLLTKKRPSNAETGRKRNNLTTGQGGAGGSGNNAGSSTNAGASGSSSGVGSGIGGSSGGSNSGGSSSTTSNLHNGSDATFLKPDPVAGGYTMQEYYECDEILKLRQNALKKEDADLQLETEKLERERNLHIRELKRIHNEDQVIFFSSPLVFFFINIFFVFLISVSF